MTGQRPTDCGGGDAAFARLQARAKAAGWRLVRVYGIPGCGFAAYRWGRGRELADAAAVENFLQQVEPRNG